MCIRDSGNTDELNIKGIYSLGDILEDNGYKQILMIGSEAVSYTHLDVYKRQALRLVWEKKSIMKRRLPGKLRRCWEQSIRLSLIHI